MRRSHLINSFILVVASVMVSLVLPTSQVFADYRDGRPLGGCTAARSKTYFANDCAAVQIDPNGDRGYVLPRVNVGGTWQEAMYGINSIESLLAYLKNNNASSDVRLYGPSAFVAHSMLGRSGDQANVSGGKKINATDWVELENRLRGPGITYEWNAMVDARFNTSGRINGDVAFVDRGAVGDRAAILIRHNGVVVYSIQRECANPIGDLPGLPALPPVPGAGEFSPSVSGSPNVVTVGDSYTFSFRITNTSQYSGSVNYIAVVRDANGAVLSNRTGTTSSIPGYGFVNQPSPYAGVVTTANGDRICGQLTVVGGSISPEVCITTGKKPLFQVWNGDTWAGGSFGTGATCPIDSSSPGNIQGVGSSAGGSWGEYGVFAIGGITNFGSAGQARYAGQPATRLSFANTSPSAPGYYWGSSPTQGRCLTDMFTQFDTAAGSTLASNNLSDVNTSGIYRTGDATLVAPSPIDKGMKIVIVSSGTITIDSNGGGNVLNSGIRYRDGIKTIEELPLVVILAKNIVIKNSVGRIDAWLAAKGDGTPGSGIIYTCEVDGRLTTSDCNTPLNINAPVVADKLILRRTYGSGDVPAEKFNLRPDAILRAYADKSAPVQARTIYEQELPPRY